MPLPRAASFKNRLLFPALIFGGLLLLVLLLDQLYRPKLPYKGMDQCPFCNKNQVDHQKVFENEHLYILLDQRPLSLGHCLIIPKEHAVTLDQYSKRQVLLEPIDLLVKATRSTFRTDDYLLLQKNGPSVGQSVGHLHFHYIPHLECAKSPLFFWVAHLLAPWFSLSSKKSRQECFAEQRDQLRSAFLALTQERGVFFWGGEETQGGYF